jgi:hypothetical protein
MVASAGGTDWDLAAPQFRNGPAVAWIGASSSKGGLLSAMTVHGVTCIKLAGTVVTSEPNSLRKAIARNSTRPAVHWNIPWQAGRQIMQGRIGQQEFKNK